NIAGCMYRVVQTTGPDGKNLLKLLPISKSSGSFVPTVQSSGMSKRPQTNISSTVHLTFKTQLASPATPSSVKIPVFQSPNPGQIILTRTLEKQEGSRAGCEKERPAGSLQSSCVPVDRVSVQNAAVTSSSHPGSAACMLVNAKKAPVAVASAVLPSGHHLQIPADAVVKSVPASSLPHAIQQKILTAAATSASGGADGAQIPTVIYVSPVYMVRTVLPKPLQAICPKQATEVSKPLMVMATGRGSSSPPEPAAAPDGQQSQRTPMKWVVQDTPQASGSCLIPIKSSNNVASKILKTLSDMKNIEVNAANILPLCSSSSGGSQTKIPSTKDNALVMYNGKIYLLTKRGSDVLSAQSDKQESSFSDASLQKETAKLMESAAVNKITNEVMNLMFSKSTVLSQNDLIPDPSSNSSPAGFRDDLKSAPAALSVQTATPSASQQEAAADQGKSLSFSESTGSGVSPVPAAGTQGSGCWSGQERSCSSKAASADLPQSRQERAVSEDWQQIQCETMNSPRKVVQIKQQEKPHWKQYLELRKKFGLCKEERVYLKRIPSRTPCENSEERVCSSNSLKRKNDSGSSSLLDVEEPNEQQECVKEEQIIVDHEEDLSKKKKIKSSPLSESGKRRRTPIKSTPNPGSANSSPSSSGTSRNVSPPPVLPQQSVSSEVVLPTEMDAEQDPSAQPSEATDSSVPIIVSCEGDSSFLEGSFRDDTFHLTPPDLDETIRDEKIRRLKQLLREREAALEEVRRK
ncbi:LRIF1 factor, partial [Alcedo cyanopectus]|nr:LRIF1 factor [Ceyx cyanopectus]